MFSLGTYEKIILIKKIQINIFQQIFVQNFQFKIIKIFLILLQQYKNLIVRYPFFKNKKIKDIIKL